MLRALDVATSLFATLARFGAVHVVCNNAGVAGGGPIWELGTADWDFVLRPNLWGVIHGVRVFAKHLVAQNEGHIVNTASLGAFFANSGAGIYSASKFAVHGLSMAMRDALKDHGIGVSVLCPANIRSNIAESVRTRPAHLANSGFDVDEREIAALHEIYSQGMDPEELAGHVREAIGENRFYIIPYPEARPMLEAAFQQVIDALPPPDSDLEGQEKRHKAMMKYIEARREMDTERYGEQAG